MLTRFQWQAVPALFSGGILLSFAAQRRGVVTWAVYLLPLSGLFMSVIYPTLNSKGISCLPKAEHGAGAGVILFFTCVSAVVAPLAMGAVSDAMGHIIYGFWLATGLRRCCSSALLLNWLLNPTRACSSGWTPASIVSRFRLRYLKRRPCLITILGSRRTSMCRSGSPRTAITSANLPSAIDPDSRSAPITRAASSVIARITVIGSMPSSWTQRSASIHVACPVTSPQLPTSVPNTICTPRSRICATFRLTIALISS